MPYRYLTATSKYKFRLRINELPLSVLMLLLLLQFGFEPTSTLNTESLAHSLFPVHSIGFYHFGTQTYTPNEKGKKKRRTESACSMNVYSFSALMKLLYRSSIKDLLLCINIVHGFLPEYVLMGQQ